MNSTLTEQDIIKPLQRFYDDFINSGNLSVIDEIIGPNYINHAAPFGLANDKNGLKKLLEEFILAFPDQHIEAKKIFAKDDLAIAYWEITGTHQGKFFGVEPTGKKIRMTGIDIDRVQDGKIVEHWGGEDMMILLSQIGAIQLPKA
jgi:predicted ester cyclase